MGTQQKKCSGFNKVFPTHRCNFISVATSTSWHLQQIYWYLLVCEFGVETSGLFLDLRYSILNTLSLGIQLCLGTDGDFTGRPQLRFAKDWR